MPDDKNQNLTQTKSNKFPVTRPLWERVAQPTSSTTIDPLTLPNRIGVMLDVSGSMNGQEDGKRKIDHLIDAMQSFVASCSETAIAVETFPGSREADEIGHASSRILLPLTESFNSTVLLTIIGLRAGGGTPMAQAIELMSQQPLTRGVLLSDGDADSPDAAREAANLFAQQETPIDCVHIGRSRDGEALLKEIASLTGGFYIKFDDVSNFSKNFKYLTPGFRGLLASSSEAAALLGAREVK